jgi:glyceraldehyde 3-phosphate dehydrogenase
MKTKVAINGFGRIGRNVVRAIYESGRTDIEVVAINDLGPVETNAHLMRYDSVHGRFPKGHRRWRHHLDRGPKALQGVRRARPEEPALGRSRHRHRDGMHRHLHRARQGRLASGSGRQARAGLGPAAGADKTIVYGVNHDVLTKDDLVVSNASCTTNCLSPVAKVLNDAIGIEKGMMTTIHSYTGDQPTLDTMHKDLYRARAAAMSMIPTSTGAAKAVGLVLPELNGKLDGVAIRVPTPNVSVVDLKFIAKRETSVDEINAAIRAARRRPAQGHSRLHRRKAGLHGLQPRSAFVGLPHRPDQGDGRHHGAAS